jgi:3-phosphoshikimate 1-carboxyvinyltransferase
MSRLTVRKSGPIRGEITVPGDKSVTHRAVILSAISEGTSIIHRFLAGEDCYRTVQAFRTMGVEIIEEDSYPESGRLRVKGVGIKGLREPGDVLDMGNSGTSLRLLTGLLSGQDFFSVLTGDDSLRNRPMRRVVEPLTRMGARITGRDNNDRAPLAIRGGPLHGIRYESPVSSAQVKSALLLAGLQASGPTTVVEPVKSRDHTERMLRAFGAAVREDPSSVTVRPGSALRGREVWVPGDLSSAAFFIVAGTIVEGSELMIRNVGVNPTRTGLLEILQRMGARIELQNRRERSGEPVADLVVRSAPLAAVRIGGEEIPRAIDEFPILCVAAAAAAGVTVIEGAKELRVKESDRIATMTAELRRLGVEVEERPDGMRIVGRGPDGPPLGGAVCRSYGDHRVAMAMAVAGLIAIGETTVEDTECVNTSFPGFERLLLGLGLGPVPRHRLGSGYGPRRPSTLGRRGIKAIEAAASETAASPAPVPRLIIAIDGPAGAGKSSAAKLLAKKLGYDYLDTGALYRAVAWILLKQSAAVNESGVRKLLKRLRLVVKPGPNGLRVDVNGRAVGNELRTPQVSRAASAVAAMPSVRKWLLPLQRRLGRKGGVVAEGRDIGTVVFPKAAVKFFLTADPSVRAQRRQRELVSQGTAADETVTRREVEARDLRDAGRKAAPLRQAKDAIVLDSTGLTLEEVVQRMMKEVEKAHGV